MCIPFPEPWEFIYASLFTSRDFRHHRAMLLKVECNIKTRENHGKELYNMRVITIYCQHNWIFLRQKKIYISIHYLTGQNRGLSGLKNIWPVIMTGNLLSVIFSPVVVVHRRWSFIRIEPQRVCSEKRSRDIYFTHSLSFIICSRVDRVDIEIRPCIKWSLTRG